MVQPLSSTSPPLTRPWHRTNYRNAPDRAESVFLELLIGEVIFNWFKLCPSCLGIGKLNFSKRSTSVNPAEEGKVRKRDGERDKERERERWGDATHYLWKRKVEVRERDLWPNGRTSQISGLVAPPPCLLLIGTDPRQDGVIFSYNGKATPLVAL